MAFALFFCGAVFSFSKNDKTLEIEGFIKWYGNSPVGFPGIVCDDGRIFSLKVADGADFVLEDVTKLQGNKIHLEGKIDENQKIATQVEEIPRLLPKGGMIDFSINYELEVFASIILYNK